MQNSQRYFKLKEKWRGQSSNKFLTTNVFTIHVHCTVGRGDDGSMFVHVTQNFGIYMYTKDKTKIGLGVCFRPRYPR